MHLDPKERFLATPEVRLFPRLLLFLASASASPGLGSHGSFTEGSWEYGSLSLSQGNFFFPRKSNHSQTGTRTLLLRCDTGLH